MSDPTSIDKLPEPDKLSRAGKAALQVAGGAIPFAGGVLSSIASAWSDKDQEKINRILEHWIQMLRDELQEKEETILEVLARVDLQDEAIAERVESREYQSLLKKTFRDWAGAESEMKRELIRNILANAAATRLSSDDVVRLFIDWLGMYSEFHFHVIGAIYSSEGISRGGVWRSLGREPMQENSADADLYKLLFRDLSTGGIIRQRREIDYHGNFIPKKSERRPRGSSQKPPVSAFDDNEGYELTELGRQFVHYAMTDLPLKVEFQEPAAKD